VQLGLIQHIMGAVIITPAGRIVAGSGSICSPLVAFGTEGAKLMSTSEPQKCAESTMERYRVSPRARPIASKNSEMSYMDRRSRY